MRTEARVASETPLRPLSTRLTVASLTPAFFATSARRLVTPESYVRMLQKLNRLLRPISELMTVLADRCRRSF
ncbi:hypothetical protein Apa02nite_054250 [Actinoplanes palleronii]|uniref:Uncharacterized protein n=1 Tax=Actinoplanes palleronii TaxID=113570 RepID=A0ABQ4BF97_9ACTN|nr:hypothetical protein Apa02nite_054250 [Actinoplanes palleronii]